MERKLKDRYLQIAKELRRQLNSEKFRSHPPERAFIEWYILARFGHLSSSERQVVDGASDGGIDAITYQNGKISFFQMKYEVVPRISNVGREELGGFEKIANLFIDKNRESDFNAWLETVREELHPLYEKYYKLTQKNPENTSFVFVTSKFSNLKSETVRIEDVKRVLSLWDLYREGFTPPTDSIQLRLQKPFNIEPKDGNFITYVGLADVRDFLKLMQDDSNERLFAQNVRTNLKSTINKEIKETYERDSSSFWLGNNGVYIVCKEVKASGNNFELVYPSIINGSQTLHSIFSSKTRHECIILVRILEMDVLGNQRLLGQVIRRTNTQNPMKMVNLLAHDPYQLNVARFLDQFKIFYERREGEWKNEKKVMFSDYLVLGTQELGQWLSTLDLSIGFGRARSRPKELFQEKLYNKIFSVFPNDDLQDRSYSDLALVAWSGLFVKQLIKKTDSKNRVFIKIPHLLIVRGVYEAIKQDSNLESKIKSILSKHNIGKSDIPTVLMSYFKKNIIFKFKRLFESYRKRNPQTDYSNFFKSDKLCSFTYEKVFLTRSIKSLSKVILNNLEKIK